MWKTGTTKDCAGGEHSANNASFLLIGDSVDHRITKSFVNLAASSVEDIVAKSGYSVHTLQGQTAVVTPSMDMVSAKSWVAPLHDSLLPKANADVGRKGAWVGDMRGN